MTILEANGLGKRFGGQLFGGQRFGRAGAGTWALRDCSLSIPQGRVVALVGPNGAGKTTLLQVAAGLLTPTEGTVRVFDQPAGADAVLPRIGFVAQEKPLYDTFTVAELLRLGQAMNPRWDNTFAVRRLAALDIPLRRPAGKLSGGQQAQVALTLALAKRPDLLLLDEPVANLDPLARTEMMRHFMAAVAEHGTTIVISSHVLVDLAGPCDWLVLLNRGRVQVSGDVEEVLAQHAWLTGPTDAVVTLPPAVPVLSLAGTGRQTDLLVRTAPPADRTSFDPQWTRRPVTLEDLVLAYLGQPDTAALPGPAVPEPRGVAR